MSLTELADEIHAANKEKGFYARAPLNNLKDNYGFIVRQLCLIHSEVSEALEELREGSRLGNDERTVYYEGQKPEGFPVELADVLIRTLDLAAYCHIDIQRVVDLKLAANREREHMHGGKNF